MAAHLVGGRELDYVLDLIIGCEDSRFCERLLDASVVVKSNITYALLECWIYKRDDLYTRLNVLDGDLVSSFLVVMEHWSHCCCSQIPLTLQ